MLTNANTMCYAIDFDTTAIVGPYEISYIFSQIPLIFFQKSFPMNFFLDSVFFNVKNVLDSFLMVKFTFTFLLVI